VLEPVKRQMAKTKKVVAVASAGGHWHQLCLICQGFDNHELCFVSTLEGLDAGQERVLVVTDCHRKQPLRMVQAGFQLTRILQQEKPNVVISTGALPGLLAVFIGRMRGCTTIWVDSVANAETPSFSGKVAKRFVSLWLSQWPHVAEAAGERYEGSVL